MCIYTCFTLSHASELALDNQHESIFYQVLVTIALISTVVFASFNSSGESLPSNRSPWWLVAVPHRAVSHLRGDAADVEAGPAQGGILLNAHRLHRGGSGEEPLAHAVVVQAEVPDGGGGSP